MTQLPSNATFMVRLANGQEFGPADLDLVVEWTQQRRVPVDALLVPTDGTSPRSVLAEPRLRALLHAAPPTAPTAPVVAPNTGSVLIPTGNPCALAGYYLAVFSILFFPLSLFAIVFGILGLRARVKNPAVHGLGHAIVAIVLGILVAIGATLVIIYIINNA